jgi:predicted esterase
MARMDRLARPRTGTAAGVRYLALPPTAVDARPDGDTRLILSWHGFDPPRTPEALAAAIPMTGVPTWRVYLQLPAAGATPPAGLGGMGGVVSFGAAVEGAVATLPEALADLRHDLDLEPGPIGLAGFSAGGTAALLAVADDVVPVSAAALITPIIAPARTIAVLEQQSGVSYRWSEEARAVADRLALTARLHDIARRDTALLLIAGSRDRLVRTAELTRLRELLTERGARKVDAVKFRMAHALAAEPGLDVQPPTPEAVSVDGALTDWFCDRLAVIGESAPPRLGGPHLQATKAS